MGRGGVRGASCPWHSTARLVTAPAPTPTHTTPPPCHKFWTGKFCILWSWGAIFFARQPFLQIIEILQYHIRGGGAITNNKVHSTIHILLDFCPLSSFFSGCNLPEHTKNYLFRNGDGNFFGEWNFKSHSRARLANFGSLSPLQIFPKLTLFH